MMPATWCVLAVVLALFPVAIQPLHAGVTNPPGKRGVTEAPLVDVLYDAETPNCTEPVCEGPLAGLYCSGKLIHASWMFGLQDSCPGDMMLDSPQTILAAFNKLEYPLKRTDFVELCKKSFAQFPYLRVSNLSDWTEEPPSLQRIKDPERRLVAKRLNDIWKYLGRRFDQKVFENPEQFPVLPVPNTFVVPGGAFQMYFYWDSYWILKGLLHSNMTETARGMIENFATVIRYHGFIPNSGMIQLSRRSQPPLFTQMVADYYDTTRNKTFLETMLPYIDAELTWWATNRTLDIDSTTGQHCTMFQFRAASNCPRPENYLVDLYNGLEGASDARFIWSSIASACESGLDFSSRWFAYTGPHARTKYSIRTNNIVPVDLNAMMVWNYDTAARLFSELDRTRKAEKYTKLADSLWSCVEQVLWNRGEGVWLDYDLELHEHRDKFYPSHVFPLLTGRATWEEADKVNYYLSTQGVLKFRGGIPSSVDPTCHEQWDFPNGWAPSIHLFAESLRRSAHPDLMLEAAKTAEKFIKTVYNGLFHPVPHWPTACWEKYDVRYDDGHPGVGGEYPVQQGFGWTNGAVMDMIMNYDTDYLRNIVRIIPKGSMSVTWIRKQHVVLVIVALLLLIITCTARVAFRILGRDRARSEKHLRGSGTRSTEDLQHLID